MAWNSAIDLYCERLGPGLFAEPLNAVSNLAFIAAAAWLYVRYRRGADWTLHTLTALLFLIGLGSGAFHLSGQAWGVWPDVGFIALFIHFYVACWFRGALYWRWRYAALMVLVYIAFSVVLGRIVPAGAFDGSGAYLPALCAVAAMALTLALLRRPGVAWFVAAAVVFSVSLTLRSYDLAWCARWPAGTHWAWHVLNACTLWLAVRGLETQIANGRPQA
jgi:hypothetical protein